MSRRAHIKRAKTLRKQNVSNYGEVLGGSDATYKTRWPARLKLRKSKMFSLANAIRAAYRG